MPKAGIEPRSSEQKRISLYIRPWGSWLLCDKITLIFAHVPHIFVFHFDRTAYKRCHFIGWRSPLSIRTSCFRLPSDWSNEVVIYSCYRGQTRSGSHGMEGVEDGLKYRGLRRWWPLDVFSRFDFMYWIQKEVASAYENGSCFSVYGGGIRGEVKRPLLEEFFSVFLQNTQWLNYAFPVLKKGINSTVNAHLFKHPR